MGVAAGQILQENVGAVLAAVVDEDDLIGFSQGSERSRELVMQPGQVVPLVLDRNDDRQIHVRHRPWKEW